MERIGNLGACSETDYVFRARSHLRHDIFFTRQAPESIKVFDVKTSLGVLDIYEVEKNIKFVPLLP